MKAKQLIVAIALTAVLPVAAVAGPYLGANFTKIDADGALDHDFSTMSLKGGYEFTDWFALEGRYGVGISDSLDKEVYGSYTIEAKYEVARYYGVYGRFTLPNSTMFKPYLIAGYTEAKFKESFSMDGEKLESYTGKEDGFSYGAGLNLEFNENFAANIEYMRMIDNGDIDVNGLSLGVNYRF